MIACRFIGLLLVGELLTLMKEGARTLGRALRKVHYDKGG